MNYTIPINPSWTFLLKIAFARIFCREAYDQIINATKNTCVQCGCKMLAGIFIIGAMIFFPSYASLTRAQCTSFTQYRYQYRWLDWNKYWPIIEHSDVQNINPALGFAIVDAESNGNERAISHTGARGAWQVQPEHHYKGNPQDLHHYYLNTMIAMRYLAECKRAAKGNLTYTLRNYERGRYGRGLNIHYTARIEQNLRGTI